MVVNQFAAICKQYSVFIEKIQEHSSGNSLVAVEKAVIFCNKIQKMCSLFFESGIQLLSAKRLIYITDAAFERVVFLGGSYSGGRRNQAY